MADTLTYAYAADIVKSERDDDGDLLVYGKATGSDRDMDGQRCDPEWLKSAMPDWYLWGNVREMHQAVCAGVGVELTNDGDDWFVKSKVVDPSTAKKIEAGALKGYSIGVKAPVINKRDGQEWIAGGSICELSYVDRPCLPTAKMMICKAASADKAMEPVEAGDAETRLVPTPADLAKSLNKTTEPSEGVTDTQAQPAGDAEQVPEPGEAADGAESGDQEAATVKVEGSLDTGALVKEIVAQLAKRQFTEAERDDAADKDQALPDGSFPIKSVADLKNAIRAIGRAKDPAKAKAHIKARAKALGKESLIPDNWKAADADLSKADGEQVHDPAELKAILDGLVNVMKAELDELADGEDEVSDLEQLLCSMRLFTNWWSSEAMAGETDAPFEGNDQEVAYVGLSADPDTTKAADAADKTSEADTSENLAELVKSAVADAAKALTEAAEERSKALTAELDTVKADLQKALALPEPGGPVLTRTATQEAMARKGDAARLEAEANDLLRKAAQATDPWLAQGYRERAKEALEKAAA